METFDYKGACAYSLTIVTSNRTRAFANQRVVEMSEPKVFASAEKYHFDVVSYCFMPDHFHLLLAGRSEGSSLNGYMRHFKQPTGYEFKQRSGGCQLWQPSYWDHVARVEEDIEIVARYIWENPVRKGLVKDWRGIFRVRAAAVAGVRVRSCALSRSIA